MAELLRLSSSECNNNGAPLKRLVERDLPYHQSTNFIRVRHQSNDNQWWRHWYSEDWFHVLLRVRTPVALMLFVISWTVLVIVFAGVYMYVDRLAPEVSCGLSNSSEGETIHFQGAFAFSLETTTTVGYGLPNGTNGFFENCMELQIAIYFQMLMSMTFNAFLLSFVFASVSRSQKRGAQVIFSNKAVIKRENVGGIERYILSLRIFDADSMQPVVEAHVRLYAVVHGTMHSEHNKDVRYPIRMQPMRLFRPNDDLGSVLFTSLPSRVSHHIDFHSPISPPSHLPENGCRVWDSNYIVHNCKMDLREVDTYTGGQDGLKCSVCGETYNTSENLIKHIQYSKLVESHDDIPVEGSHQEIDVDTLFRNANDKRAKLCNEPWYREFRQYFESANIELICVFEAIDPYQSGTFQAIQSYTIDDINFDEDFDPCVLSDSENNSGGDSLLPKMNRWVRRICLGRAAIGRSIKIDLEAFHKTSPVEVKE